MPRPEIFIPSDTRDPRRRRVLAREARAIECGGRPCDRVPGPRLVALLGTPCGGTTFTARAAQHAGLDVGHEHMHSDGIVCGWSVFGWRRTQLDDYEIDTVVRIMRHPLRVLETLPAFAHRKKYPHRDDPAPWSHVDPLVAALRWWVLTHEHPRLCGAPVLRVGHWFQRDWRRLLDDLGNRAGRGFRPSLPNDLFRRSKRRRWHPRSWADVHALDSEFATRAEAIVSEHYGSSHAVRDTTWADVH